MDHTKVKEELISEISLNPTQADVYLLITCHGRMSPDTIAERLGIPIKTAQDVTKSLVQLGAFIEITDTELESMHPRFTAVNMYKRMCERQGTKFARNNIVDAIGAILEKPYEDARAK